MISIALNDVFKNAFFEGFNLTYNTVANNDDAGVILGSYDGSSPAIQFNNIFGNANNNVVNNDSIAKDATNNWWGSTSSIEIESKIRDFYDDVNLGIIEYSPFQNGSIDIIH